MTASVDNAVLLSRIEDASLNASAPPQQRWVDGWLVRYSPGKAKRARCINALSVGRLTLEQRLAACQAVYDEHRLPMVLRVTPFTQPPTLDEALQTLGYQAFDDTRVMLRTVPFTAAAASEVIDISEIKLKAFAHIVGEFRDSAPASIVAHAQRLESSPVPYQGHILRDAEQQVLACALSAPEGDRVGLYDVFTAPAARGRGLSRRLCTHVLQQAAARGARVAYLQVDADNHAARAVYGRLGFTDAYSYHYRALPGAIG